MNLQHSTVETFLASVATGVRSILENSWRALFGDGTGIYRPEAHYMRGPGPKWRELHGRGGRTAAR